MKLFQLVAPIALATLMALPAAAQTSADQTLSLQVQPGTLSIANNGGNTHSFAPIPASATGPQSLSLTTAPSYTITDNTGSFGGWKVNLQASPSVNNPQTFPNHLNYVAGSATLTPSSVHASVEGQNQGVGNGNYGSTVTGTQDLEASALTYVSAANDITSASSSTYTLGTQFSLDVGTNPILAGTYNWTITATVTSTP